MSEQKKSAEDIRNSIKQALHQVAPDVDLEAVDPDAVLRDELEIDSMDLLRFITLLHEDLHIDVPESDYRELSTLNKCFEYLNTKIN
jgi:acyl carrier protein